MIKCPFCHFDNEDGALFCERCTSDLTALSPTAAAKPPPPPPPPTPVPIPMAEAIPLSASPIAEPMPFEAIPIVSAEPISGDIPMMPMVMQAEPIDLAPMGMAPSAPEGFSPFDATVPAVAETMPVPFAPIPAVEPTPPSRATPSPVPMPPAATIPSAPAIPAAPAVPPTPAAPAEAASFLPPNAQPRLLVLRGQKRNVEYPIYEGLNFVGRADEKPVDIDLEEQEPPDRIWCSRQHACISWEDGQLTVEDLNSANGTYVNRTRVYPGQKRPLNINDIVQIGNVQLKVLA